MQELKKILEEVEEIGNIQFASYTKPLIAVEDVIKIIRKHMNDGWIPCEKRMPDKEEYCGGDSRGIPWLKRLEIAYMTDTVEYIHGYYDGYKWMDKYLDAIKNVVAWRIHEPYRPERRKDGQAD